MTPQNTTAWLQDQWVLYNVCAGSNLIFSSSNFFVLWEITSFQQNPGGNPAGFSCQQLCSPQTPLQAFFASSCYLHTIPCWGWSVLLVRRKLQLPLCPLSSLDISSDAENKDTEGYVSHSSILREGSFLGSWGTSHVIVAALKEVSAPVWGCGKGFLP